MKFGFVVFLAVVSSVVVAQGCPNGIPSAGNPGCISPDQSNSPYHQSSGASVERQARWADRWGAIAVDDGEKTIGIGIAEMASSERAAKKIALEDCRAKGGTKCVISLAYYNQCAVIVWGSAGYNSVSAETVERASKRAIERCSARGFTNCDVYYSGCSFAERVL
ncbi:DUF4189 domain-containing protein [Lysobacter capsici]|uniref:DUF4189 domain-containing protein n=1 Tax=Lysobacter capsici TaxID=435897 RepID=UPI0009E5668C